MNEIVTKILNIGVASNTSDDLVQRMRITNRLAILGFVITITIFSYALLTNSPTQATYFVLLILVLTIVPLLFNHYNKNVVARVFIVFLSCISLLGISILLGEKLNYQYFYIPAMYTPFLLFGSEQKTLKWVIIGFLIVSLMYLHWHFTAFEPLITMEASFISVIHFSNNILVFLVCLSIYYFFVTENEAFEDKMIEQTMILEEKNKHLEHFAYIAAHDLNEPLRTINSFIDIIKEDHFKEKDKDQETYFTHIQIALLRMRAMIDGLLTYSRIGQSGQIELKDSNKLIEGIKKDLAEVIKEKKAIIKIVNLPKMQCCKIEMRQLFQNLITNGIKFQSPGVGPVLEISCLDKKTHWEFCCADNGIGISPKHFSNL